MGSVRLLGLGCVLLALAACGGGGGGGGGNNNTGNFTIATSTVTFDGDPNGPLPPPQTVNGSITGVNETVFLTVIITTNGIASATVSQTSDTTGQLQIFPKSPMQLGFGTFTDTITVRACLDQGCARHVGGSPKTINVTYNVRGLTLSTQAVQFTATEALAPAGAQATLGNHTGANWTTSIDYQGSATTGWLTVTPNGAATPGTQQVMFSATALSTPGSHTAVVQFSAGNRSLLIPVSYVVSPNIGVNQPQVQLSAVSGQTAPPTGRNVEVSAAIATTYTPSVSYGLGATDWLNATGSAAPGTLNLVPNTVGLAPGQYLATVTLTPNGAGAPVQVDVVYVLAASQLSFTRPVPAFSINGTTTNSPQDTQRLFPTFDSGAPLTWTTSEHMPWFEITPSGTSGDVATLTLLPSAIDQLSNGRHFAVVDFTYNGPFVVNQTVQVAIALDINLPTIKYAMPYVAYLDEQKEIVLRGSGFLQTGGADVTFDGTPATTVEVVNDTTLRVTPPASAVDTVSQPLIAIDNALGLPRSTTELFVRAKPDYGNQSFAFTLGLPSRVTYDAERDLVFAARTGFGDAPLETLDHVLRFALDPSGTAPAVFTKHSFPGLWDIAMSPDGATLYVLTQGELRFIDPVTMIDQRTLLVVPDSARILTVLNDGRILLPNVPTFYSPEENRFDAIGEPLGHGSIATSADGSRVGLEAPTGTGKVFLGALEVSPQAFQFQSGERFSSRMSLDRGGTRIAHGGDVFDASDLSLLGSVDAADGEFSVLSPNGDRLYAITFSPTSRIHVWDTSVSAATFPELTPIDVTFGAAAQGISLNGEHLFLIESTHLIIVEL